MVRCRFRSKKVRGYPAHRSVMRDRQLKGKSKYQKTSSSVCIYGNLLLRFPSMREKGSDECTAKNP
jgi:hypothetical protein